MEFTPLVRLADKNLHMKPLRKSSQLYIKKGLCTSIFDNTSIDLCVKTRLIIYHFNPSLSDDMRLRTNSAASTRVEKPACLFIDGKILIKHQNTSQEKVVTSRILSTGMLDVNKQQKITLSFFSGHLYPRQVHGDA